MFLYLEKIDPQRRQMRFYALTLGETLFGEWCLMREWGRIGSKGGQSMCHYGSSRAEVQDHIEAIVAQKQLPAVQRWGAEQQTRKLSL